MAKILIVEDDLDLCARIVEWLTLENHTIEVVHDGKEGSERIKLYPYELVVLDWGLPGLPGIEVCRSYRAAGGTTPILMLTGKSDITQKTDGLDSGADDYLTKPFHLKELSARIRALLRRPQAVKANVLSIREYSLDTVTKQLKKSAVDVQLTPKEYALVEFMMRHPDQVFSQEDLLNKVWSSESESTIYSIYTTVKTLRKKLNVEGQKALISTVHGMGYRIEST